MRAIKVIEVCLGIPSPSSFCTLPHVTGYRVDRGHTVVARVQNAHWRHSGGAATLPRRASANAAEADLIATAE